MRKAEWQLLIDVSKCRGCRSCQLACSFAKNKSFNPAKSYIRIERDVKTELTTPVIDSLRCDLCGGNPACAEACPYGTIKFEKVVKVALKGDA